MDAKTCPACGDARVMAGYLTGSMGDSPRPAFIPRGGYPPPLSPVGPVNWGHACLACGHFWRSHTLTLDPAEIRRFIRERCGEIARQELDEIDFGPGRDLPATDLGREIGAKVSELDGLARERKDSVVTRRFRDLAGVSWDEAIKAAQHWHRMTRAEKLALFGWVPKEKPAKDDLSDPLL